MPKITATNASGLKIQIVLSEIVSIDLYLTDLKTSKVKVICFNHENGHFLEVNENEPGFSKCVSEIGNVFGVNWIKVMADFGKINNDSESFRIYEKSGK